MNGKKVDWDVYYLTMAFAAARRSSDPSTRHGCVIVSCDNRVLSFGYNGPIKGANDALLPMERPQRYWVFIHAEENAILSYSGSQQDIVGATAYITGHPCHRCLRMIIQKGLSKAVYCDVASTKAVMLDETEEQASRLVLSCKPSFILSKVLPDAIVENAMAIVEHASGRSRL